jgi:hypothetical protein
MPDRETATGRPLAATSYAQPGAASVSQVPGAPGR